MAKCSIDTVCSIFHTEKVKDTRKLVIAIIGCELVGIVSTPFTISAIPTWYASLNKPVFSPPNWVFGPVWTTLYFLMGVALYLVWREGIKKKKVKKAVTFFLIQLALNFIWSPLFFGMQNLFLGLVDIIALLVFLIITIVAFYRISKIAAYLLIPYLLWVSFATILNFSLLLLNP